MANRVSLSEIKTYLGLDGEEQNALLTVLLSSAEHICEKVLRRPITDETPPVIKTAVMFVVWQLYFHRDEKEFEPTSVEGTVAIMLSDIRKKEF